MSLVWMLPALGVSVLTIAVVLRCSAGRLNAAAVGVLMLLEGISLLLTTPRWSGATAATTGIHGTAMLPAGAGIWAIAYRAIRTRHRAD